MKENWDITAARYVVYLDIMGFKDLVSRTKHEAIYEMMKKINERKQFNSKVNWGKTNSELVKTTTYSDSIMIYSKDDSYESLYSTICTTSGLTNDLLTEGIPHKGALAFGIMTLDTQNSIFFGQPLIDAFLLEGEINFYGILVHGSAEIKIDVFNTGKKTFPFLNHICAI